MPVSTKGAMAEPSHPSGRPLELEDRRSRAPAETASKRSMPVSPLAMERWAIVLRRHRAGYAGYEQVDPRAPRAGAAQSSGGHEHVEVAGGSSAVAWTGPQGRAQAVEAGVSAEQAHQVAQTPPTAAPPATDNLVGLAMSGGGIRSATFGLGALQALHKLGLLGIFDYVSTVSGGGFTGAWWSAWLSRAERQPRDLFPRPRTSSRAGGRPRSSPLRIRRSRRTRRGPRAIRFTISVSSPTI